MARGKDCYLWDVDDHRYLDYANHHTAQILGHGHRRVEDAVREQLQKGIALGAPTGIEGAYHGNHDAVEISVAPPHDLAGPSHAPSPAAASETLILPFDDEEAVEWLVATHAHDLACVLFDPKAGLLDMSPEFARAVRDITRRHGVLLIFDEIVSFRTDVGSLQKIYGVDPDRSCFRKIVGGGFPVGAFGGRADLMDLFDNS